MKRPNVIPGSLLPRYANVFSFPHNPKVVSPQPQNIETIKNSENDRMWPVSLFAPQGLHLLQSLKGEATKHHPWFIASTLFDMFNCPHTSKVPHLSILIRMHRHDGARKGLVTFFYLLKREEMIVITNNTIGIMTTVT